MPSFFMPYEFAIAKHNNNAHSIAHILQNIAQSIAQF